MFLYLIKRILFAVPIVLGVSILTFALVFMAPGDPISAIAPADAPDEVVQALKVSYGLDRPVPVQYLMWLKKSLSGDLGVSIASGRPVRGEIATAFSHTLSIALIASFIGVSLGFLLGGVAGFYQNSWIDRVATLISLIGISVPHYWLGLVLTIVFSVWLGWLPAMGAGPDSGTFYWDFEHLKFMLLPAITMAVIPTGIITRSVKSIVADILSREFLVSLKARGLTDLAILKHVIRNALPMVLAVVGLQIGYLMGGSILIETVFSWPGTGFLLNIAIFQRDFPLLQGIVLILCMFFVALNLMIDILQSVLDPRIMRS
ncbi:ABC transporter permease [Polynucleobacter kasalickyi]|uniref:Peptide/nickel transport system permease protein n=1 Tax=Polynucleobacter kasalickyi TaxID=1938817 RepID=A0A1W2A4B2_9BURK|nr:ABC transporter permease [Polynucleobacter kasalickyi]SMC55500.1 peptide/nickel transport system permease protein [Polynucleobacter kasalickyi]